MVYVAVPRVLFCRGSLYGRATYLVNEATAACLVKQGGIVVAPPSSGGGGPTAPTSFDQTFPNEALQWTVNHNLGRFPTVALTNLAGAEIDGAVLHVSNNLLTVNYSLPTSGRIRCA